MSSYRLASVCLSADEFDYLNDEFEQCFPLTAFSCSNGIYDLINEAVMLYRPDIQECHIDDALDTIVDSLEFKLSQKLEQCRVVLNEGAVNSEMYTSEFFLFLRRLVCHVLFFMSQKLGASVLLIADNDIRYTNLNQLVFTAQVQNWTPHG